MYHIEYVTFILECLSCSHSFQDEVEILEGTFKALYDLPSSCFISFLSRYSATHFLVPQTWSHMHTHMCTNRGAQIYTHSYLPSEMNSAVSSYAVLLFLSFACCLGALPACSSLLVHLHVFLRSLSKTQSRHHLFWRKWPSILSVILCFGAPITALL